MWYGNCIEYMTREVDIMVEKDKLLELIEKEDKKNPYTVLPY